MNFLVAPDGSRSHAKMWHWLQRQESWNAWWQDQPSPGLPKNVYAKVRRAASRNWTRPKSPLMTSQPLPGKATGWHWTSSTSPADFSDLRWRTSSVSLTRRSSSWGEEWRQLPISTLHRCEG